MACRLAVLHGVELAVDMQAVEQLMMAHADLHSQPASEQTQQLPACLFSLGTTLFKLGRFEEAELALLLWLDATHPANTQRRPSLGSAQGAQRCRELEARMLLAEMKLHSGLLRDAEVDSRLAVALADSVDDELAPSKARLLLVSVLLRLEKTRVRCCRGRMYCCRSPQRI